MAQRQMSREKALTARQFEQLLLGANRIEDDTRSMEARAVLLIAGRLGLRGGELTHLNSSWVNYRQQMLHIPSHEPCEKGRDGGLCGYCKQAVSQMVDHDDTRDYHDIAESYWNPKTDAAVRDVPYGWDQRTGVALEWLIDEHGCWPHSFSTMQRRLDTALEASAIDETATTMHGLRATAASFHAGKGVDSGPLQSMFGWSDLETARNYIAVDGAATARALGEVHG